MGTIPVLGQWLIAVVGISAGLALIWRIFRKLAEIAEAMPVVLEIADQFEIPTDKDARRNRDASRRDPRKVLPILIDIAAQFEPNAGTSLYDRVTHIEKLIQEQVKKGLP